MSCKVIRVEFRVAGHGQYLAGGRLQHDHSAGAGAGRGDTCGQFPLDNVLKILVDGQKEVALRALGAYDWPGNVRELKNLIERLVIMTPSQQIDLADLPMSISKIDPRLNDEQLAISGPLPDSYRDAKEMFEKRYLLEKLEKNGWNISRTAEEIGLERSNLHRKIKGYGLEQKKTSE